MPLHFNLYHEVQRQELARKRDPLRLGMLGILVISIGFLVNYFVDLERAHIIGIHYSALNDQWSRIEPRAKAAKARQDELNAEIAASDAMIKSVDSRFYWAPVLDEILKAVPRSVQLTHVSAEEPNGGDALSTTISINGISSAVEPRKEAEAVRIALNSRLAGKFKRVTSAFKDLDDSDQFVTLDGRRLATATFSLEFQIQVRDPEVPAQPATAARKSKTSEAE